MCVAVCVVPKTLMKGNCDHFIEFVNKNTKIMLTIMATWLTGVRHRLILTKNLEGEFNKECEKIQYKGSTQGESS